MIPILYEPSETDFATNGLGRLADAISCKVTEERNGSYELEMVYPMSGIHYRDITYSRLIFAKPSDGKDPQPFRIYEIARQLNGQVTIRAEHISYRMADIPVTPFTATTALEALEGLNHNAAVDSPFTFWTDKTTTASFGMDEPASMRTLLGGVEGSILDVYGGEWEFDRFTARLWSARGTNTDVTIRYGKNLTDLKQEESIANTYAGILPYWKGNTESDSGESEAELVVLDEKVVYADNAASFPYKKVKTVDLSSKFQSAPTQGELRAAANTYIKNNDIGVPSVSVTVSFIPLWQTEEYKDMVGIEHVNLCDTVQVEYEKLGVSVTAKVTKTVFDVLTERYESIELGNPRTNLASSTQSSITDAVAKASHETRTALKASADRATKLITGGLGGYVVIRANADGQPEELLVLGDDPDYTKAQQVWRWNKNGLGYSSTGYNGEYTTAITADGHFVADFIDTGALTANLIKAGILTDGKALNYWNMETGEFSLSAQTKVGESTVASASDVSASANSTLESANSYADSAAAAAQKAASDLAEIAQTTADGKITTFYQDSAPASEMSTGDLWIDTDGGNNLYRYDGSSWIDVQDGAIGTALAKAQTAQSTADEKIVTFAQATEPAATDIGDIWIDTDDNNQVYRWSGTTWVPYRDGMIAESLASAKSYADNAASGAVNAQTQESIFNKLTNNGETQGIYLKDGKLYLNATYIATGTLADAKENTVFDLSTGTLTIGKGSIKIGDNFSVDASGNMTANNAQLNGSVFAGDKNGKWVKINTDGTITVGSKSDTLGKIDMGSGGFAGIRLYGGSGVLLGGDLWVGSGSNYTQGATTSVTVGGKTLTFVNGLMTTHFN